MHNSGLSTDAKHCGVQAGYEKGLKVMAAVATGADLVSGGFGFLDSSSTFSLPMVPVDAEFPPPWRGAWRAGSRSRPRR